MLITKAYAQQTDTIEITQVEDPSNNDGSIDAQPEGLIQSIMGSGMMPMILIFGVFYFLLIRPQNKKRKEHAQMVEGVKVGEKILTSAGMFGVVTKVNDADSSVNVEISKDVNIQMLKSAISDIISRKQNNKNAEQNGKTKSSKKEAKKNSSKTQEVKK
ncbi:MAG: preprotein translocase subunit YajC [Rickettsiaceae bacterium]